MSRAFVKEDAEPAPVHFRKVSPAPQGARIPLTLSGASRLKDELKRLKAGERPASSQSNGGAAERIALLEEALASTEIVDVRKLAGDQIRFGATVLLQDLDGGKQSKYQIIGELEANLKVGCISVSSPLARGLVGREVGELVQVQVPGGGREYEILEILWVEEESP
jgi:transcription elongation factor GreA